MMDRIEVRISKLGEFDLVDAVGEIDVYNSFQFKGALEELLKSGSRHIILQMDKVRYIDSSALGALITLRTKMQTAGAEFFLVNLSEQIRSVLDLTKMSAFFSIYAAADDVPGLARKAS